MSEKTRLTIFPFLAATGIALLIMLVIAPHSGMTPPRSLWYNLVVVSLIDIGVAVLLSFLVALIVAKITGATFGSPLCAILGLVAAYYLPVALGVLVGVYVMTILGVLVFLAGEFAFFGLLWGFDGFETVISVLFVGIARLIGVIGLAALSHLWVRP